MEGKQQKNIAYSWLHEELQLHAGEEDNMAVIMPLSNDRDTDR
jgi:hypothetical protein